MAGRELSPAEEERVDSDPDRLRARIDAATGRLAATAAGLTDARAREPSRLPGWSRGHVLTHLARNADGLRNLLIWARTGAETPQYPSQQAREAGIEAGAGRAAAVLAQDVQQSAAAFAAEAATLPPAAWQAPVRGRTGPEHPAWFTLVRRLGEVEIHHADLGAGYAPPDWPAAFVADQLERAAGQFAGRDDVPACVIEVAGTGQRFTIGPGPAGRAAGAVTVAGPGCWLLAWLIGRDAGAALSVGGRPADRAALSVSSRPAGTGQEPAAGRGGLPPKLPTWG